MKVIFLDIDGVLNNGESLAEPVVRVTGDVPPYKSLEFNRFDRPTVDALTMLIEQSGAKLVLSSTWRYGLQNEGDLDIFNKHLKMQGCKHPCIGMTPIDDHRVGRFLIGRPRGKEIQEWLDNHPEVDSFVIIDDDDDMVHLTKHLVQTNFLEGFRERHVPAALKILNNEFYKVTDKR